MYGFPQRTQIIRVNGENGANAFQMTPDSNVLLLDNTAPLVWLVQTDGAGYKTVTPYKIEPYVPEPAPNINSLIDRISKLEEKLNGNKSNITGDSEKSAE